MIRKNQKPREKRPENPIDLETIAFQIRESYKTARANIVYSIIKKGCKKIVFTSSNKGEGKTVTSVNVAIALAQQVNTRVLIIDCDLRRPQLHYDDLRAFDAGCAAFPSALAESVEIAVKYEGYIRRQRAEVADFARLERRTLPEGIDYAAIDGLRLEAREKLSAIRPRSLGQAGRISGVSPADLAALMIWLDKKT